MAQARKKAAAAVAAAVAEKKTESSSATIIHIPSLNRQSIFVTIEGLTVLLQNRFSEEAIDAMERDQTTKTTGKKKKEKEPRNPEKEFNSHIHFVEDTPAHPASGLQRAVVATAKRLFGEDMVKMCGILSITNLDGGELIPIEGKKPTMRRDVARAHNTPFIVYRPEYPVGWKMTFRVTYNTDHIDTDGVCNLINQAGCAVGIGSFRVENKGTCGQFHVVGVERPEDDENSQPT